MPEIPQVQTCCFCWSTEIGCKIIGWWLLITGILQTIGALVLLIGSLGSKSKEGAFYIPGSPTEYAFDTIVSLVVVLMGVYLLLGVYKKNMRCLKIWLTIATIYLVILIVGSILMIFQGHTGVLAQIINLLLAAYFIIVVHSYYRENLNSPPTTY